MTQRITIDPVSRIEGHAKITIDVGDDGRVADAIFHVVELRGFERICEGRPFEEMPGLMARVCGICPVSHVLASSKAGDQILGVEAPAAAVLQRRLANYAQVLQSHALSFFHLSSPDLLLGLDTPAPQRNLFGLIDAEPELARRGIRLRQLGQRVIELVGGRRIHPSWSLPGGVATPFTAEKVTELRSWIPEAYTSLQLTLARAKRALEELAGELEHLGSFTTMYLGMVGAEGDLKLYDGRLRLIDGTGATIEHSLDPRAYARFLGEVSVPWSYVKPVFYRPRGYPAGTYRVGPLARLNVARSTGTPRADLELLELRSRVHGGVLSASYLYHWARLIEMLHCVERIDELLGDPELLSARVRAHATPNHHEGVGVAEAPRGTLFHHYTVDEHGRIERANLLIATAQNNAAMNLAVKQAAERFVDANRLDEAMLNRVEAAIRCYDPCLSCSTHALGQMPLVIELRDARGALLDRVERG